jgi:hypothetical protein
MLNLSQVSDFEIDEVTQEIFEKYKYALAYIGVDFEREDVQNAVIDCSYGMEEAFQTTISYWIWKQNNNQEFEFPSAFLIAALSNQWKPYDWKDEYLNNPNFKSPSQLWWEEAAVVWGAELRNTLVADVSEDKQGSIKILFLSGKTLSLRTAKAWGWERVLECARGEENAIIHTKNTNNRS